MVGEIRDQETARIAVQASLTGHFVLSTMHTNDAVGTVNRIIDMGVEPFLVASVLKGVVAQRLIRRVCPACAVPLQPEPGALRYWNMAQDADLSRLVKAK
ncbi:ATPase, T2SS/T4P/T4SS family, partial [Arthrospira platensis SPKY1]|nr:ATPase, T2SS/T4P/T4SS family [Arthrospira platensis SPKY1]